MLDSPVRFRNSLGFYFNGSESMQAADFEHDETLIFDRLIAGYDLFVNIGANVGYYVCKALNEGVDTVAFEPNQQNVNLLLANVHANRFLAEFQVFPLALSDFVGILPMYGASTGASLIEGWAGQSGSVLVPVSTFDRVASSLVESKKCFVIIDVEGAELDCLKGATSLLSCGDENLFLLEIGSTEHQPNGVEINPNFYKTFQIMSEFGYSAYTASRSPRAVSLAEAADVQNMKAEIETHNFIFVKHVDLLKECGCAGLSD